MPTPSRLQRVIRDGMTIRRALGRFMACHAPTPSSEDIPLVIDEEAPPPPPPRHQEDVPYSERYFEARVPCDCYAIGAAHDAFVEKTAAAQYLLNEIRAETGRLPRDLLTAYQQVFVEDREYLFQAVMAKCPGGFEKPAPPVKRRPVKEAFNELRPDQTRCNHRQEPTREDFVERRERARAGGYSPGEINRYELDPTLGPCRDWPRPEIEKAGWLRPGEESAGPVRRPEKEKKLPPYTLLEVEGSRLRRRRRRH